jgi:hypothetical protein
MKVNKDNLTEITIKSYIKHFGLKVKNGFLYKGDLAIYTDDLKDEDKLLSFLLGLSCVLDSLDLWNLKEETTNK